MTTQQEVTEVLEVPQEMESFTPAPAKTEEYVEHVQPRPKELKAQSLAMKLLLNYQDSLYDEFIGQYHQKYRYSPERRQWMV